MSIIEPIHFAGPSPGDQSAIVEEEKKEQAKTSKPEQLTVTNQDDSYGAAQQSSPDEINTQVQRPIKEETKAPEPSQTIKPTREAIKSAPSINAPPKVNQQPIASVQQSADPNQATLLAFQSILSQQLKEQRVQLKDELREQLQEQRDQLEEQLTEKLREQRDQLEERHRG